MLMLPEQVDTTSSHHDFAPYVSDGDAFVKQSVDESHHFARSDHEERMWSGINEDEFRNDNENKNTQNSIPHGNEGEGSNFLHDGNLGKAAEPVDFANANVEAKQDSNKRSINTEDFV